jgi:hypothetical protein
MNNFSHGFSVVSLLLFPGMALIAQGAVGQEAMRVLGQHDARQPYRAWVMCVDMSLSPTEEQFHKSLAAMEQIAERDITYNDLVWLIDIQSTARPAKLFAMPASCHRRSAGTSAADNLRDAKASLIDTLRRMSQVSDNTDLKDPIETALDILRAHTRAVARNLVVGSDFLTDVGHEQVSLEPPKAVGPESAAGVTAWLLVTYPKGRYLRHLRMSQSELLATVKEKWVANFRDRGASRVNVVPVDAIPVTVRAAQGGPAKKVRK